jgi:small GTP-binding protein
VSTQSHPTSNTNIEILKFPWLLSKVEPIMDSIPTFKVLILGDAGVGKTSLSRALEGGPFDTRYIKTFGCNVNPIRIGWRYQRTILNVWDLAGDEKFRGLDTEYYKAADVVLVCFDLTSDVTLQHCEGWIAKAKGVGLGDKLFILVGLKNDLHSEVNVSPLVKNVRIGLFLPNLEYFEVSSKTGAGISSLLIPYLQEKLNPTPASQPKL